MLKGVSDTPFGNPVVPDEHIMNEISLCQSLRAGSNDSVDCYNYA